MAIFYHVSLDMKHTGHFTPRIPKDRFESEDGKTPRICVSDSVEGCLSAIPDGILFDSEYHGYFKLFVIDTAALNIPENAIMKPVELYETRGVFDALITREHWLLDSFTVPDNQQFICNLTSCDEFQRLSLTRDQLGNLAASLRSEMDLPSDTQELFDELMAYAEHATIYELIERTGSKTISHTRDVGDINMITLFAEKPQDIYLQTDGYMRFTEHFAPLVGDLSLISQHPDEIVYHVPARTDIRHLLLTHHAFLTAGQI